MSLAIWWTFVVTTFFICGSPGPNMLQVMSISATYGWRRALYAMAGCLLGVLILIAASVMGIGALLKASPMLFDLLRWLGAAYLLYLAVQLWRAPVADTPEGVITVPDITPKALFRNSFLVGISNPKALLFAAAFFPQFIEPGNNETLQLAILFLTFIVLEIGWYFTYAIGGSQLAALLKRASIRRVFNRIIASLFAFFGAALVARSV